MGFYQRQLQPRLLNATLNVRITGEIRQRVCEGLHGDVLEIGYGSGLNQSFLPAGVSRVSVVDPSSVALELSRDRRSASTVPVVVVGDDAERLDLPDDRFDAALSTWTLCAVADPTAVLREVARVLKPGGELHFVEHGLAPDDGVQRWQHRLEPLNKRLFGGCHLTRPIADLVRRSGFAITELDTYYEKGTPKALGFHTLGVARPG